MAPQRQDVESGVPNAHNSLDQYGSQAVAGVDHSQSLQNRGRAAPHPVGADWEAAHSEVALPALPRVGRCAERLTQIQVAAQPYAGLTGIVRHTLCWRRCPLRSKSGLEGEGRCRVGSRHIDDDQPGLLQVHFIDRVHIEHHAGTVGSVPLWWQHHPTEE
jgi:hypothetical protein